MSVNPSEIARSFPANSAGDCPIVGCPGILPGERIAYLATMSWSDPSGQIPTKGPNVKGHQKRPSGCTCDNGYQHSKGRRKYKSKPGQTRCPLNVPCSCGALSWKHKFTCDNAVSWEYVSGIHCQVVHISCAQSIGFVVSAQDTTSPGGSRGLGVEDTTHKKAPTQALETEQARCDRLHKEFQERAQDSANRRAERLEREARFQARQEKIQKDRLAAREESQRKFEEHKARMAKERAFQELCETDPGAARFAKIAEHQALEEQGKAPEGFIPAEIPEDSPRYMDLD